MPSFNRILEPYKGFWFFSKGDNHAVLGQIISHAPDFKNSGWIDVLSCKNALGVINGKAVEGRINEKEMGFTLEINTDGNLFKKINKGMKERILISKVFEYV